MPRALLTAAVVLAALVGALAFQAPPNEQPDDTSDEAAVIAHAGASGHAPENTLPAFERALALGADALEMDLQLTADGELVVIHDGTVDRTTDGSGAVADLTVAQLEELDAGFHWEDADGDTPFRGHGVEIPTFEEVVDAFPGVPLVVEMKTEGGPAIVEALADAIDTPDLASRVTVSSFDLDYLEAFRARRPRVATNIAEDETRTFFRLALLGLDRWWTPPGEVLHVPEEHEGTQVISPGFVAAAERRGTAVHVWTVNEEPAMHRLLNTGVHGLITDYPDRAVAVQAQREAAAEQPGGSTTYPGLGVVHRLQALPDWLDRVAEAVTSLGDGEFYLLVFPLLYWCVHRRLGLEVGVVLLLSAGVNQVLKLAAGTPRPLFLDPSVGLREATSFGLPSGHAQQGVAVWGLIAADLRTRWAVVGAGLLALLLGWSRVQLGVHFPVDTLTGWAVGAAVLAGFLALRRRARAWLAARTPRGRVWAALAASLTLAVIGVLARLSAWGWLPPASWVGVDPLAPPVGLSGVVTATGALFGLAAGVVWLSRRGGFDAGGDGWRRVLRYLVGVAGILALTEGLDPIWPDGEDPVALVYAYLRFAVIGAWIGGVAPWVFVRLRLASPLTREEPAQAV